MSKKTIQSTALLAIALFILGGVLMYSPSFIAAPRTIDESLLAKGKADDQVIVASETTPAPVSSIQPASSSTINSPISNSVKEYAINASLKVGTTTYTLKVASSTSLYSAMVTLASTTLFVYQSKYYPGLGYFIEAMNGIANKDGAYWTLYVNGVYSQVGASSYIIKNGDAIEWKYEKK